MSVTMTMSLTRSAQAQNEAALRQALEGRMVTVKVDMPGTSKGIDVFPEEQTPVDWREVAQRMKDNGTALRMGQSSRITKVVVKGESHIEVQLGGGGFGTFGDNVGSPVSASTESDSKRERMLRDSIKAAPNGDRKKQFEKDLANARDDRERQNARSIAAAATANEAREANLRVKRAEGGSRFNVRYKRGIPADALTADGVLRALAQFLDAGGGPVNAGSAGTASAMVGTGGQAMASGGNALISLKKGLSISDVESLFGPANTATESKEGSLTLMKRTYVYDGKKVITAFVNGVLIDYGIAPQ
jgi:hypothetical protein